MVNKAIVSAHIWKGEDGENEVEILDIIHDDHNHTGIFDDIDHALLEQITPNYVPEVKYDLESELSIVIKDNLQASDYYFMAIVEAEFVTSGGLEYVEHDIEYEVTEIKSIEDVSSNFTK